MKIFLTVWFVLGTLVTIAMVGKARRPTTAGAASITCLINGVIVGLIWALM